MPKHIPTRAEYRRFITIPTRWADQDALQHVNNATYYSYFDTAIGAFLAGTGLMDDLSTDITAVAAETMCRYHSPAYFPDVLSVGLRVGHIGTTSVRYEIGVFREGEDTACADGHFVHVHVEQKNMTKTTPIPDSIRKILETLLVR
ncbi:acyl-CoA thioester hydrolase, YbgC/YbaW family [Acetobacteraceae bacterium AT-5844]|nr:acyl-CoA thioester hydrolase, YbgC/YbaW family [Acetobacteraceae bacterium AT-5844]